MKIIKLFTSLKIVNLKIGKLGKRFLSLFLTLAILVAGLAVFAHFTRPALAGWWPSQVNGTSWLKRQMLTVTNNSGDDLASGTTIAVTVDTKSLSSLGKLQNNCVDLRVVYQSGSNYTELDRFISYPDGGTCATSEASKVYFKLQAALTNGSSSSAYYMYYANPQATTPSNPDNAFDIDSADALLVCPFDGTTTCAAAETPSTATGAIRYSGSKSALSFDGVNDNVDFDVLTITPTKATIEFWVYRTFPDTTSSNQTIINIYTNNFNNFRISYNQGLDQWGCTLETSNTEYGLCNGASPSMIPKDTWTHVSAVWDSDGSKEYKLFINGTQYGSTQTNINTWSGAITNTNLGASVSDIEYFTGLIDEVRISSVARYTSNFTPPTSPFIRDEHTKLLYHFDENGDDPRQTGKAIDDACPSGTCNHGTITGAKYVAGLVGVDASTTDTGKASGGNTYAGHEGIFIEEATTNKITNPSFEHSTYGTNWTLSGGTGSDNTTAPYYKFGSHSYKIVLSNSTNQNLYTSINAGNTNIHTLSAYVYRGTSGNVGGTVNNTIAQIYWQGAAQSSTTYTDMGGGWWRMSYSAAGTADSRNYGVTVVEDSGTFYIDGLQLEAKAYSTTYADGSLTSNAGGSDTYFWDDDCDGTLDGGEDQTADQNAQCSTRITTNTQYATSSNINANPGSISFWAKLQAGITTITADQYLLDIKQDASNEIAVYMNAADDDMAINTNGTNTSSTGITMAAGAWQHFILTYDFTADQYKLYQNGNGTPIISTTTSLTAPTLPTNFVLGADSSNANKFNGSISDFRSFNAVLTAAQVTDLYYSGLVSHSDQYEVDAFSDTKGQNPVGIWHFDESSGASAHDSSRYANDLTVTNTTWSTLSEGSRSQLMRTLKFDGSTSIASRSAGLARNFNFGTDPFSISGWFRRPSTVSDTDTLVAKYNSAGYKVYMNSSGYLCFGTDDDSTWGPDDSACTTTSYADSKWHNFNAVRDSTTLTLYVDGLPVASDPSIAGTGSLNNTANFAVGVDSDKTNFWDGFLDEIIAYPYARSANQVKGDVLGSQTAQSYGSLASDPLTQGLIGYWKLDESSGGATDYSGNSLSLTNNGTTTYVVGKFGNGSEHVPASSQYFSAGSSVDTYYFDASDNGPIDAYEVWNDDSLAFDGSLVTNAFSSFSGSSSINNLSAGGTNAPSSGGTISQVRARLYGKSCDYGEGATIYAQISSGDPIGTPQRTSCTEDWSNYTTLTAPGGSWDWSEVQSLSTKIYADGTDQDANMIFRVEVEVTSGSSYPTGIKAASFWVNPDSNTNYYLSLTSSAYITSSSGTLSATGFTNPKIYVNDKESSTVAANIWQLVTVTSDTAINADQFYVGRQGSNYYDGTMDEFRIYNRALSPTEVTQLYNWAPGPVAYYKLDENTGTTSVNDSTGNGNTGTMTGTMTGTDWVPGKFGSALDFDGTNDAITIATANDSYVDFNGSEAFTGGAWVYIKTMPGSSNQDAIITKYDETSTLRGYRLVVENDDADTTGNFQVEIYDESADQSITASGANDTVNQNTWYHVEFTFNGGTAGTAGDLKIYTNGVITGSNSANASFLGLEDIAVDFSIGDYDTTDVVANNTAFTGIIDAIIIYNYVRTPTQIIEDINAGHPAPGSPIGSAVAEWKFDEGYGTTANDQTNNDNDLTLSTSASWVNGGKFGKAWHGTGGGVRLSRATDPDLEFSATDDFTLSTWFKSNAAGNPAAAEYLMADGGPAGSAGYALYANTNGYICFGIDDDTSWEPDVSSCTTTDYYDNTWHLVTAVRNVTADTTSIYIDGILQDSDSDSTSATLDSSPTFYMGDIDADDEGSGEEFAGEIDEAEVYRLALTADQVKQLFLEGSAVVWGAASTDSSGVASWSSTNDYCPPGQSSACTGPLAEWKMDENTSTNAYDTSGNGFHAAFTNLTATAWTPGVHGPAIDFPGSGSNEMLTVSENDALDFTDTDDFTIEGWFSRDTADTTDAILFKRGGVTFNNPGYSVYILGIDNLVIEVSDGDGANEYNIASSTTFTTPGWHHFAAVFDEDSDTNSTLYVDGVVDVGVKNGTIGNIQSLENALDLYIGHSGSGSNGFDGKLDDIRIYDYARTPAQVAWDYNHGGPVAWYKFDEASWTSDCATDTIFDSSGNANRGDSCPNGSGQTSPEAGKYNTAIHLDDSDDYITVVDDISLDLTNGLSISAWVNTDANEADNVIVSKGTSYEVGVNADGDVYWDGAGAQVDDAEAKVLTGAWHHIVVTNNDTTATYYVDGVSTGTSAAGVDANNATALRLGYDGTNYFDGLIDDVRIYNYVLTQQQIKNIMNEGAVHFGPATGSP